MPSRAAWHGPSVLRSRAHSCRRKCRCRGLDTKRGEWRIRGRVVASWRASARVRHLPGCIHADHTILRPHVPLMVGRHLVANANDQDLDKHKPECATDIPQKPNLHSRFQVGSGCRAPAFWGVLQGRFTERCLTDGGGLTHLYRAAAAAGCPCSSGAEAQLQSIGGSWFWSWWQLVHFQVNHAHKKLQLHKCFQRLKGHVCAQ